MTTIHVQRVGDKALLPQSEFERLVELARQYEKIAVQMHEDDVPTLGIMRLAEQGGAFDFWREAGLHVCVCAAWLPCIGGGACGCGVSDRYGTGFRTHEIRRITRLVIQHQATLLEAWHDYFGT